MFFKAIDPLHNSIRLLKVPFLALCALFFLCGFVKPSTCFPCRMPPKTTCKAPLNPRLPPRLPMVVPTVVDPPPFKQKIIVIDPGHGGEDLGTQSTSKPRYKEKHLNLATAKMLQQFLEGFGYRIVMTRTDDTFITLERRAEIANLIASDLFVSVHYNSAPVEQAKGIEIFFYRNESDKDRSAASKILAALVLNKVIENTEAKSRGVKHGDLSVIRNTKMPAILVEGGFLTNTEEMNSLKNPSYLKKIAWGIAQGIHAYLSKN